MKILALVVMILISVMCPAACAVSVTVAADTLMDVNGQTTVPDGIFGATAYEGADFADDPRYHEVMKQSGIRRVGLPGVLGWLMPGERPAVVPGWADTPEGKTRLEGFYGGYNIPSAIRNWRKLGFTPMVYLLGFPGWVREEYNYPDDAKEAAEATAEYVALLRQIDPNLTWFHFTNEPNANWYKINRYGKDYARAFVEVAKAVKKRNPGVKLGGPALCWPPSWPPDQVGQSDWYTWEMWSKPLIDIAGDNLDFFDFHQYGILDPTVALSETQCMVNAMWNRTGKRKPVIISEYGTYLTPADVADPVKLWQKRIDPWMRQVMAFLEYQPDKIVSIQPHDLHAQAGGEFKIIKSTDPKDQFDFYRAIQLWRPLKGQRLAARSSSGAVKAFASCDGDNLAVVLSNSSGQAQSVRLKLTGLPRGARIVGPVESRSIRLVTGSQPRIEHEVSEPDAMPSPNTLQPGETRSFLCKLSKPTRPARRIRTVDLFGDSIHASLQSGRELTFRIRIPADAPRNAINPRLRIAALGFHEKDIAFVRVTGRKYSLRNTYWQEVPISSNSLTGDLTATFQLQRRDQPEKRPTDLRITSVCLAVDYPPTH